MRFTGAFLLATVLAFAILLLDPSLGDALRTFWDRTLAFQLDRESPFSLWGWGQYHARGISRISASLQCRSPGCGAIVLAGGVVGGASATSDTGARGADRGRCSTPSSSSLTHWPPYLPWRSRLFVLLALFLPRTGRPAAPEAPEMMEAAPPEMAGVS